MEQTISKYNLIADEELQGIDGGAIPLIPVVVGFVKGFVYTGGAILTARKLITGK